MKGQRLWIGLGAFAGISILILDSRTALIGAQEGIILCLQTVIPSLFPFFMLSNLLTGSLMGADFRILRPIGRIFGLPKGAQSLLIPAFLGGYPAGAQSIAAAYQKNQISKRTAEQLLAFCNNAGPAFLFGMVGPLFPSPYAPWALWAIHIIAAWMVSLLFRWEQEDAACRNAISCSIPEAMAASGNTMAMVCGWVVMFRILIRFLNCWVLWLLPTTGQIGVAGLLELANGCCSLPLIASVPVRFVLCSVFLAFGGLCVTMQTASAVAGLSMKPYITGKTLQALFGFFLSAALWIPWMLCPLILTYFLLMALKFRKNSRNLAAVGV